MGMHTPKTLADAIRYFADPANCREYMVAKRWPNGVTCPQCGSKEVYFDKARNGFECKTRHPKRKFTLKTGTIFEDSPLGLDKWLPCVWMIANMKNGVSSHEISRSLGVTQKTAWFMLHRVRLAMQNNNGGKLSGSVEVDETYIGAKARNMHKDRKRRTAGRTWYGKVAVMGLLERHTDDVSQVRMHVLRGTKRRELFRHMDEHIEKGSNVYTDALASYQKMNMGFAHSFVDHAERYADGEVHTNGLENFWSLLKRSMRGTYVSVEPFHLFRYLDEHAMRFNNRKMNDAARFELTMNGIVGRRLTYKDLIGFGNAPNGN